MRKQAQGSSYACHRLERVGTPSKQRKHINDQLWKITWWTSSSVQLNRSSITMAFHIQGGLQSIFFAITGSTKNNILYKVDLFVTNQKQIISFVKSLLNKLLSSHFHFQTVLRKWFQCSGFLRVSSSIYLHYLAGWRFTNSHFILPLLWRIL